MRSVDVHSLYPETLTIGSSLSVLVSPLPGQLTVTLKYGSGGTLWFSGSTLTTGCTFATAQRYLMASTEIFNFVGAGQFKLEVTGATTTVYLVRGRSAGFDQT